MYIKIDKEALKELGKGFINLANLVGGLSFVNVFLQQDINLLHVLLVVYIFIGGYVLGYQLIRRSNA